MYNHIIRLKHIETRRNLHSHHGYRSPITGQQEATAFGNKSDENDHWSVERFGYQGGPQSGGEWRVDDVFILRHVPTGHTLRSHEEKLGSEDINEVSV
ncbi:MIR motif-containing protein [Endogone sp. FLAS-F59071]|nr:MIR motif-containing protein [Endogone sp. FLAS-F59071]|eukprot:RUS17720.1 MIR motif-containing protein [Endogone sp. FLAS-F59071]